LAWPLLNHWFGGKNLNSTFKFELDNNSNKFELRNWLINITQIELRISFGIMSLLPTNRILYYKSQIMRLITLKDYILQKE
jgi:hypothetical protein